MSKKALIFLALLILAVSQSAFGAVCPEISPLSAINGFNDPSWIAIDKSGNLYITDTIGDVIHVYSQSGRVLRKVPYTRPLGIAVDSQGVYVTDTKGTLTIYSLDFSVIRTLSTGIKYPLAVAASVDRIYVTDPYSSMIKVYSKAGDFLFSFAGGSSSFNVVSLAIEPATGDVYVVTRDPSGVFVFDKDGNFKRKFYSDAIVSAGIMVGPRGILSDNSGRIYITDAVKLNTFVFDDSGASVCSFQPAEKMCRPVGIAMGGNNVLYIVDKDCKKLHAVGIDNYVKMNISPLGITFKGQGCGISPDAQALTISNEGKGVLKWNISSNSAWIIPSLASGELLAGTSSNVSINVDTNGLSVGTHSGSITVSSQGASETVDVAVEIASPPSLIVAPLELSFLAKGRDIPPSQGIEVELSGDVSAGLSWASSSDSAWLSVSPLSGPSNTLSMGNVSVDVTGLQGGVYSGNIIVSAGCAIGSPALIPVKLTYIKGGTIKVSTNLDSAAFQVAGTGAYSGTGTSYVIEGAPEGIYTIIFGKVSGFKTPSSYSLSVANGQTTEFVGNYRDLRKQMKIVGTMAGGPESIADELRIFERTGSIISSFIIDPAKKSSAARYSSQTASGDIDGDGKDDILAAKGKAGVISGYKPDGSSITGLGFTAFKNSGSDVSSADLNGDGIDEIIVSAAPFEGNLPEVRVFSLTNAKVSDTGINFLAYASRSGVNAASGDIDGDNVAEIITTEGGSGKDVVEVRVWKVNALGGSGAWTVSSYGGFTAGESFVGADIAAGDIDGDGIDEIILATVPQPSDNAAKISVFRADGTLITVLSVEYGSDITISAGDTDFDGIAEIVIGDSGSSPRVRVYDASGSLLSEFNAFDNKGVSGIRISLGELGY